MSTGDFLKHSQIMVGMLSISVAMGAAAAPAHAANDPRADKRASREARDGASGQPLVSLSTAQAQRASSETHRVATALRRAEGEDTARLVVRLAAPRSRTTVLQAAASLHATRVTEATADPTTLVLTMPVSRAQQVRRELKARPDVTSVVPAHRLSTTMLPNDSGWSSQSLYLSAVQAPAAWDVTHGSAAVRIAVIDSGVDVTHPDLAGKVVGTYNAVDAGTDVTDTDGHGTAVAGIAAAATNDASGIAGSGYDSSLLAVKVEDPAGEIWSDAVASGIMWAADHSAGVINLSLGSPDYDVLTADAVTYARSHGVVVVAAAGNEGTSTPFYPAALPGVVAVGATSTNGSTRTSWSSFGPWVDVAAPGAGVLGDSVGGGMVAGDGTSFAAPLVAGEAALLRARQPASSEAQVAAALTAGTGSDSLGFAHGLVNFRTALAHMSPHDAPAFTSPRAGAVVSGTVTVSANSTAPVVRFTGPGLSKDVPVVAGVASTPMATYGLAGQAVVRAASCEVGVCSPSSSSLPLTVSNPAPVLTAPTSGAVVTGATVTAAATARGGAVAFTVDGIRRALDATPPYSTTLPVTSLTDGKHTLASYLCNATGSVCDSKHPSPTRSFTVGRHLHPSIASVSPSRFSPNTDRRRDSTTVSYRLDQVQKVAVTVQNASGTRVVTRLLGSALSGGSHTWVWNGRTSAGATAASGTYKVSLATSRLLSNGQTLRGLATHSVVVDLVRPSITSTSASPATVYPYVDHYKDTTTVSFRLSEPVSRVQMRIYNRSGSLVRTVATGARATAGATKVTWNGRNNAGAGVPAGSYRYRLETVDVAGNERITPSYSIAVSSKKLVARNGSKVVTAYGSVHDLFIGDCSSLYHPGRASWADSIGYYSDWDCASTYDSDDLAAASHQYTLPAAVRYGTVRVAAYGGSATSYPDGAAVLYYDRFGQVSSTGKALGAADATYTGPTVAASSYLIGGRTMRWLAGTVDMDWYDIRSFTVSWTYYVLA